VTFVKYCECTQIEEEKNLLMISEIL
jgi:hypothetical protein